MSQILSCYQLWGAKGDANVPNEDKQERYLAGKELEP